MLFIKQLLRFAFFLLLTTAFVSCSDDDDEPTEFIATDASFSGFASFTLEKTFTGIAGSLGPAHGGNDATSTRKVYFKNDQDPSNNKYPVGTIIVKHVTHTSGTPMNT